MTRKEYIKILRSRLNFLLPEKEISDIIADMEECFDAGLAEGKTEEEIAAGLGDPKTAAKDMIAEYKKHIDIRQKSIQKYCIGTEPQICSSRKINCGMCKGSAFLHSRFASRCIPAALCIALGALCFLFMYENPQGTELFGMAAGMFLPIAAWFILEHKEPLKGIFTENTDKPCVIGAAVLFLTVPSFRLLFNFSVLYGGWNEECRLSLTGIVWLIIISQAALIFSVYKSKFPKLLCIVPAVIAAAAVIMAVSNNIRLGSIDYDVYMASIGKVLSGFLKIIGVSETLFFVWAIINKNAHTVPILYLALLGAIPALETRTYLSHVDPYAPTELVSSPGAPALCITAAVGFFIIISIARLIHKSSAAEERPDGENFAAAMKTGNYAAPNKPKETAFPILPAAPTRPTESDDDMPEPKDGDC